MRDSTGVRATGERSSAGASEVAMDVAHLETLDVCCVGDAQVGVVARCAYIVDERPPRARIIETLANAAHSSRYTSRDKPLHGETRALLGAGRAGVRSMRFIPCPSRVRPERA